MGSSRMWQLIEKSKREGLTEEEKETLQAMFLELARQDVRILLDEGELTKCPGCGRIRPNEDCACGYQVHGWVRWSKSVHDLGVARGWQELKCPNNVTVMVHPNEDCEHPECRYYPIRHRHRVENIEEIVLLEDDNQMGGPDRE